MAPPAADKNKGTQNLMKICYCIHKGRGKLTFLVNTFSREPDDNNENGRVRILKNFPLCINNYKSIKHCHNQHHQDFGS